ncbi:uncharacterized protein LOC135209023 isoform X2 [Macrobrachium nipponense]|uniref:uncharacterized protein LOC135209023 isoform X2 n=1 Tax=Macrobrachium nipponense TaxID=159736 RepID=UPI0030C8C7AC
MKKKGLLNIFCRWWLLKGVSILFLLWTEANGIEVQIHRESTYCNTNNTVKLIRCDLQKLDGRLLETRWTDLNSFVITNGNALIILPQCDAKGKELTITNTGNIRSQATDLSNTSRIEDCQSHMNIVRKFIYNSSHEKSLIRHTKIGNVVEGGFEMVQGFLSLEDVIFTHLSLESIVIYGGAIDLIDIKIEEAYSKSIIMKGPGKITFRNLTIGDFRTGQTFLIENKGNEVLWPLAVIVTHSMALSTPISIAIGFLIGIFLTIILVVIIHFKYKNKIPLFGSQRRYLPSPEDKLVQPTHDRQCQSSSNVQEISDVMEDDYNDVLPGSPISSSVKPFFSKPESIDIDSSSVSGKPHVPPLPPQLLQIKDDSRLKAAYDFHEKSYSSEVTDDNDLIYENCEDYLEPNHITKPPNSHFPPVQKQHPLNNEKISVTSSPARNENPTSDSPRGHQTPLTSEQINVKSFLHQTKKPPAPPKPTVTKDTSVKPPVNPTRKEPGKLPIHEITSRLGQLQFPPKSSTTTEHKFIANQNDGSDEIYEDIS